MSTTLSCLALACSLLFPGAGAESSEALWRPVADHVYLQENGERIETEAPVTAAVVLGEALYAVSGGKIFELREALVAVPDAPEGVSRLVALDGALWAAAEGGAYRSTGGADWQRVSEQSFVDFCEHLGDVYGATRDTLYRFNEGTFVDATPEGGYLSSDSTVVMEDFSQVLADPVRIGPIERIASYSGTLYILRPGGLALIDVKTFVPEPIDWGMLPSSTTRDMFVQGSRLYVATNRGVGVLRGMAMTALNGEAGLPYEDTTCLAGGFERDLWIGTTRGAIRHAGGQFHYFGAENWLPADKVNDIAAGDGVVCIATDGGVALIRYEPYTLAKKAEYFEQALEEGGFKRLGFVHKLYWSEADKEWLREISDNDGGHTAHYLAAMSFKYAATGDEEARQNALDAFRAMIWLDDITPNPGFIARAIWSVKADKGKRSERGSGGLPAKWYPTDDGLWQWKGDTSSDEVNGHIYSVALFHDLVAQGPEKDRAAKHIANIASHIIENGWVLRDMDGKPTRWGRWDPEYLLRPYGHEARGLNGMEAQTYVWTAMALTGDEKFAQGLRQLIDWRYHTFTVRQKQTFPPDVVVPWDDELAFRCYHPLLTYATDPGLRSIYLRSLERHWEVMRMQKLPYFNFIYGALTGNDCEEEEAAQHLREWPLDLVNRRYTNSHRADLRPEPGYVPYCGGTKAISPRETTAMWGSRPSIEYDGGGGRGMTPPIGWLEDYWMGRYYGFIEAPAAGDPALTTVSPSTVAISGAAPYSGPPRPEGTLSGE